MKISCAMADDIMPLYVDNICSDDSKAALEAHLNECQSCRDKFSRMNSKTFGPDHPAHADAQTASMVLYAQKVRRHKTILAVALPIVILVLTFALSLIGQALAIMARQRASVISNVESGTFNLTAGNLVCSVDEVDEYPLFTNSTQIIVSIQSEAAFTGTVMLWNADVKDDYIMISNISTADSTCVFSNLTSENQYIISITGISNGTVTVGGYVNFWQALAMAWENIF